MFRRLLSCSRQQLQGDGITLRLRERLNRDTENGIGKTYTYDICQGSSQRIMGYISLRLGESPELYYLGHIGYRVDEPFRGHSYARKAVAALIPRMRQMGLHHVVITTDTDNTPSRITCERLGCILERIAPVPRQYRPVCMYSPAKCRYILMVQKQPEQEEKPHAS